MGALTEKQNQSDLVEQARSGSRDAFNRIVQLYHMDVRWFLCRKIHDMAAVDDIAQEVFLAAMEQISTLKNTKSIRSWLITIARNKAVDHLRSTGRQSRKATNELENLILDARLDRAGESIAFGHDHRELMSVLNECVESLNFQGRSVLQRFYFENQPTEEIAGAMGKKPAAIRMILLRIRKSLAKCIHKKLGRGFQL